MLVRTKNAAGMSAPTWGAFAVGNLALYIYTEKYTDLQSIIAFLGTLVVQSAIFILILRYKRKV